MSVFSPAITGFRLILRRPAIALAEITWRWSFAAAAWFLGGMFVFGYLDSLPVNAVSRFLLGTGQPILIARAMKRVFEGSAFRFTEAGILLGIGLGAGWIVLASVGRTATVTSIAEELGIEIPTDGARLSSLARLNFLRLAASLASVLGVVGSALIASSVWASSHTSVADAGSILGLFWFAVCLLWVVVNWLLSTATIPAVLDRKGAMAAFVSTISLLTANTGGVISASAFFGAVHLAAFVLASGAAGVAFGLTGTIPAATVIAFMVFVAFAYCAIADFLYICRVAAYVSIIRADELGILAERSRPSPADDGSVDKTELILSDAPAPAF
jgi:hypothetical protein